MIYDIFLFIILLIGSKDIENKLSESRFVVLEAKNLCLLGFEVDGGEEIFLKTFK